MTFICSYAIENKMKSIVGIFKSLADETRLRILVLLQGGQEHCVCDLMHALDLPQSTVSRHLSYLKRNGWLQDRRGGVWMYYRLQKDLDVLRQTELVILINQLTNNPVCKADRQRLAAFLLTKSCT